MVIRLQTGIIKYEKLVPYGKQYRTGIDKLCAFLIAISPILQHYKGLYENAGFMVLLIAFPILTLRFISGGGIRGFSSRNLLAILPLLFFEIYTIFDHSVSTASFFYIIFMMCIFICIAAGCVNTAYFLKYAVNIVSLAAALLFVQYVSYYLFHHTIDLRPFSLLVSQDVIWVRNLNISTVGRLYRPAAFFMEPSHLFLYSFPVLCILLLSPRMTKWRKWKAILITLAMLLSTSGFSIVVCIGLWALYLFKYKEGAEDQKTDFRKIFSGRTFILLVALLASLIIAYSFIPIFQRSVNRIFFNTEGSSAIAGRVRLANNYIDSIKGNAVWFGTPNVTGTLEFNLAGFFATYIKWGVIGVALTYLFYGQGLFLLKKKYFWMTAIILVISFFTAHTHGTFYMMYYIVFLMNGYFEKNVEPATEVVKGALPA